MIDTWVGVFTLIWYTVFLDVLGFWGSIYRTVACNYLAGGQRRPELWALVWWRDVPQMEALQHDIRTEQTMQRVTLFHAIA